MSEAKNTAMKKQMQKSLKTLGDTATSEFQAMSDQFQAELNGFYNLYEAYVDNASNAVDWDKVNPPAEDLVIHYDKLNESDPQSAKDVLNKVAVLKLNGGLGTTMGCLGPKSAIEVRGDQTFLDLAIQQIEHLNEKHGSNVELTLMNSFNTHEDTRKIIQKYESHPIVVHLFNQSRYPRFYKESKHPCPKRMNDDKSKWYPPGHGDIYEALVKSGLVDKFLSEGKEIIFVSNVDNLGANVDLKIAEHMLKNGNEFIMELTDKTRSDIKGGTLISYEGKARLLEVAQVPSDKVEEFKSIKKFKIFNTNNFWLNLRAVKRVVENGILKKMDVIVNPKVDSEGRAVIQLERAAGAAMQFFDMAIGVNVPRTRFIPVKTTADLFVVQSNLYAVEEGVLRVVPQRTFPTVPLVKFGVEFKKVGDFNGRFGGPLDIIDLDHLTVSGDVRFGKKVSLRGTVIIVAGQGQSIDIPAGAVLENKIISGSLRILDH
uniref:UTP--glucose-1-phosphate uridylyltransferase n=1 Tax=Paramoeba aestuarina TaxID=180227 RepID=A0A7S4PJS8_9EUKA|eukprot:CAMPEP_0201506606 /NCGR_PEP_ID=MMETSP0161_2-20130828/506_1 /ASSEMBLY_ACC=CAM_ASM_000251 /TAXON_ID=180227 /ORGANISM="Neoparamoeba aestuarina, Strain SoJaBio B1-5/56/2" /LENGTH=485 /DNA_ID=CAMNT_0047900749 /DNA_START=76 /DNA_END=1533 /DNA_ORIENTATION=+